jgi:hypothetical protein
MDPHARFTTAGVSTCCEQGARGGEWRGMGTMSLQVAAAFAVTSFVGTLMFVKGVSVHLLERRTVRCRACGGIPRRTCVCRHD